MRALIYAMLKTGGLEDDPEDIFLFLGMNRLSLDVYGVCMEIFTNQTFQVEDIKKSTSDNTFKPSKQTQKEKIETSARGSRNPLGFLYLRCFNFVRLEQRFLFEGFSELVA